MEDKKRDVIIIGGGPSGYTAAIYTSRATLSTLVFAGANAGGQLMFTTEVENFPGFPKGVLGPDLMISMQDQAQRFGAEIKFENVTKVDLTGDIKKVWVGETMYEAKAVIISTGASAKMLGVGEEKYLGRGVSTCAVCDAAFYKDKIAVVVGGGDAAMEDAMALTKYAKEVYVVHRKGEFRASKIMQDRVIVNQKINVIWMSEVVEVGGENKLERIRIKNVESGETREIPTDGLFLAIGHIPVTDMFKDVVDLDERGFLKTGITCGTRDVWMEGFPTMTTVSGVFGCGDVVDFRYKQAITAAGMGCQAALDVEKFLTGKNSGY